MTSLLEAHDRALESTGALIAAIGDDQWYLPTPCEDWDVTQLIHHVVAGNLWAIMESTGSPVTYECPKSP